jgi:hypothetical protein
MHECIHNTLIFNRTKLVKKRRRNTRSTYKLLQTNAYKLTWSICGVFLNACIIEKCYVGFPRNSGERKRLKIWREKEAPDPDPDHRLRPQSRSRPPASSWHCRKPTWEKEATDPKTDRSVRRHIPTIDPNPYPDHRPPDTPNPRSFPAGSLVGQTHQTHARRTQPNPIPWPPAPRPTKLAWVSSQISRWTDPPNPHRTNPSKPTLDISPNGGLLLWAWVSGHHLPVLIGRIHEGRQRTGTGSGDLELVVVRLAATGERGKFTRV